MIDQDKVKILNDLDADHDADGYDDDDYGIDSNDENKRLGSGGYDDDIISKTKVTTVVNTKLSKGKSNINDNSKTTTSSSSNLSKEKTNINNDDLDELDDILNEMTNSKKKKL